MTDFTSRLFVEHVKGLFDPVVLNRLAERLSALENEPGVATGKSEREAKAIARGEASDALRMQSDWYDVWRTPPSHGALLDAIGPFTWVTFPVQVRHIRTVGQEVPWHQDAGYTKLHPAERRHKKVITCFIPIEPEPWRHTTVQFSFHNRTSPEVELEHYSLAGFGAGLSGEEYTDVEYYALALGDALLFGDLALHRTFTPAGAIVERRSLEFRLIEPQDALPGKDYFDITTQSFVTHDGAIKENAYVASTI